MNSCTSTSKRTSLPDSLCQTLDKDNESIAGCVAACTAATSLWCAEASGCRYVLVGCGSIRALGTERFFYIPHAMYIVRVQ